MRKAWAGIVEGRIYASTVGDTYGDARELAIFTNRADARRRFQRIARVEIWVITPTRRAARTTEE